MVYLFYKPESSMALTEKTFSQISQYLVYTVKSDVAFSTILHISVASMVLLGLETKMQGFKTAYSKILYSFLTFVTVYTGVIVYDEWGENTLSNVPAFFNQMETFVNAFKNLVDKNIPLLLQLESKNEQWLKHQFAIATIATTNAFRIRPFVSAFIRWYKIYLQRKDTREGKGWSSFPVKMIILPDRD